MHVLVTRAKELAFQDQVCLSVFQAIGMIQVRWFCQDVQSVDRLDLPEHPAAIQVKTNLCRDVQMFLRITATQLHFADKLWHLLSELCQLQ